MIITNNNKTYIAISVFVASAILMVIFLVFPAFQAISRASIDLSSQEKSLILFGERMNSLEGFKLVYNDLKLVEVDNLFIDSEVPVEFIGFLEREAEETEVALEIAPASPRDSRQDSWPSLTFQINANGSFPQFLQLLEKLENSPYLIEINNLNISEAEEVGNVKSVFSIKVYTTEEEE